MGITFLWIGILILKDPMYWSGYIQSWAMNLIPIPLEQTMLITAILDIAIGLAFLIDIATWIAALAGALHIGLVLVVAGIDAVTVRDIGLLTACIDLLWIGLPDRLRAKFAKRK
jgi:uncharacterized membrane protein YphA (DoxX/SURF4 family)